MSEILNQALQTYWGKADEQGNWHLLIYHQLDVSATGIALLDVLKSVERRLLTLSGMERDVFRAWLAFFLSVHDLGKFSSAFQQLRPDLAPPADKPYFYTTHHDTLGHMAWKKHFAYDTKLSKRFARWPDEDDDVIELLDTWMQSVTGHHGRPPEPNNQSLAYHFSKRDEEVMEEWVQLTANLFLPDPPHHIKKTLTELEQRRNAFSWFLAGLSVLADWVGSNRTHFPYHNEPLSPQSYWHDIALPQARRAIAASGLLPARSAKFSGINQLFQFIVDPTPLQAACLEVSVEHSPQMHILEDVTGAGKTEAAFILIARILAAGQAEGAYLALPTMATANSMYRRSADVYRKLFEETLDPPSLVLAHSARYLDERFRSSVIHPEALDAEAEYGLREFNAEARCNSWLADNNKKALLAQVGVGTIDQALLAVLQSRHQSLRLFGLVGKVLVVDEVHASDAYMHVLLCRLLEMHARAGGSAILLSATLPQRMRNELIAAFQGQASVISEEETISYPLLTTVNADGIKQQALATRPSVMRKLHFQMLHHPEDVIAKLTDWVNRGKCVAWIRNTVNDAIETAQQLSKELGNERVTLFHARFAMGDRLDIENRVVEEFGLKSGAVNRSGKVVVATQVIEQSLDLDFDEMVSDLAPIDLLIQRAGRLRRHRRDTEGNRLVNSDPDQRGPVCLHVLGPSPNEEVDENWVRRLLPGTAAVYPDHGQLWLTAREIVDRKVLRIPEDLRGVIEAVFGINSNEDTPEVLQDSSLHAEGKQASDRSIARVNAIKLSTGYARADGQWLDESHAPTRLGETTVTIRLARWANGQLLPWINKKPHEWQLSEVRILAHLIAEPILDDPAIKEAVTNTRQKWPRAVRHTLLLPLTPAGESWVARARDAENRTRHYCYSTTIGLTIASKKEPS